VWRDGWIIFFRKYISIFGGINVVRESAEQKTWPQVRVIISTVVTRWVPADFKSWMIK